MVGRRADAGVAAGGGGVAFGAADEPPYVAAVVDVGQVPVGAHLRGGGVIAAVAAGAVGGHGAGPGRGGIGGVASGKDRSGLSLAVTVDVGAVGAAVGGAAVGSGVPGHVLGLVHVIPFIDNGAAVGGLHVALGTAVPVGADVLAVLAGGDGSVEMAGGAAGVGIGGIAVGCPVDGGGATAAVAVTVAVGIGACGAAVGPFEAVVGGAGGPPVGIGGIFPRRGIAEEHLGHAVGIGGAAGVGRKACPRVVAGSAGKAVGGGRAEVAGARVGEFGRQ